MSKKTIAVFMGGKSSEREVSLVSGSAVARAIDKNKYDVMLVHIHRDGRWETTQELYEQSHLIESFGEILQPDEIAYQSYSDLNRLWPILSKLDIVFPVLHGPFGEDGSIQGLLETAGIPYVGGSVLFHSLCMHKPTLKALLLHYGIPTPAFEMVTARRWKEDEGGVTRHLVGTLGLPLFVKPASLGSSIGISRVQYQDGISSALSLGFRYDRTVIVEEAVEGREIECAVMGNEVPVAAQMVGEIIPCNEFYDYEAKYVEDSRLLIPPPGLDEETVRKIRELAVRAFKVADGSGYARVDFLVGDDGPMVNEVNTIPGFTEISMFPRLFTAQEMRFEALVDRLIDLAWRRFEERTGA